MRRSRCRSTAVWGFAVATLTFPLGQLVAQQQPHRDGLGNITFALAGDAIITRKLSVYSEPEFLEVRDLMRNATAAFVNAEMLFLDYDEPDVIPASQSGGTYMRAQPELLEDLKWMGVDLVSTANNHSLDYSFGGLRSNIKWLDEAGLVFAGTGENLAEARAPHYLETPGGRVALIAVSSSFADFNRAGPQRKDMRGRPGLSHLRVETTYHLPNDRFEQLRQLRSDMGLPGGAGSGDQLQMLGATFRRADSLRVTTVVNAQDLEEITAQVRDAKRQANWAIVSSHTHQGGENAADFLVQFAHAVIDAGADAFVGHGPHVLRAVEIYKGKPIFYSLGDFLMQNETVELQPWENYNGVRLGSDALPGEFYSARNEQGGGSFPAQARYWEAFVAVPQFRSGRLAQVDLYPITLGFGLDRPQRGRPLAAKGELARKIITKTQELSKPFGTVITFENGIGVIRIGGGS
ncbi:MAG: CapA family protein [Gemmatimonadetes bacterium]|nr:CapA family protein [Gemmatimonadota bacterium]